MSHKSSDPMVTKSVNIRASQVAKIEAAGINFSEWVREKLDESFP